MLPGDGSHNIRDLKFVNERSIGSVIGGYRLEGFVGRGGMGVVYKAVDVVLERHVALKLIAPEFAQEVKFRSRFSRELRNVASIDHPHVIPVHHAGEDAGALFIAMRYVDGTDLGAVISEEGALQPARAAQIVADVGGALDAAHARGLVHRDVKPGNVLIERRDQGDHVYLTDFGLSKHATSAQGLTGTGQFVGTVDYVAPEQIRGEEMDGRADIYALGCVLFHALTGQSPFAKEGEAAKLWAHMFEPPPAASDFGSPALAPFDEVVRKAMAKLPAERYQTASELGKAAIAAAGDSDATVIETRLVPQPQPQPEPESAPPAGQRAGQRAGWRTGHRGASAAARSGDGPRREARPAEPARRDPKPAEPRRERTPAAAASPPPQPRQQEPMPPPARGAVQQPAYAAAAPAPSEAAPAGGRRRQPPSGRAAPAGGRRSLRIPLIIGAIVLIAAAAAAALTLRGGGGGVASTIRVGDGPRGIAADGDAVWVANFDGNSVTRVDAESEETKSINAGRAPLSVAVGGDTVWVAGAFSTLTRLRTSDGSQVGDPISLDNDPSGVATTADSVWLTNGLSNTLTEVDARDARVEGDPIDVGLNPTAVATDSNGVWVANSDASTVTRVDPDTGERVGRAIEVGSQPSAIAAGEGAVWVANSGSDTVTKIDPDDGRAVGEAIPVGREPSGIAAGEGFVWVANAADDTVTKIDPETSEVVGEPIPVGDEPVAVAVGEGAVWVANSASNDVSKLEP